MTVVSALLIIAALLAEGPVLARGAFAAVALVALAPAWRFALCGVRFEGDSVVVMNPFSTVRLPLRSVERFQVQACDIDLARLNAVAMVGKDGRTIPIWALARGSMFLLGSATPEATADGLNRLLRPECRPVLDPRSRGRGAHMGDRPTTPAMHGGGRTVKSLRLTAVIMTVASLAALSIMWTRQVEVVVNGRRYSCGSVFAEPLRRPQFTIQPGGGPGKTCERALRRQFFVGGAVTSLLGLGALALALSTGWRASPWRPRGTKPSP